MIIYHQIKQSQEEVLKKMNRKYSLFGLLRFLMVLIVSFSIYKLTQSVSPIYIALAIIGAIVFFILIRLHSVLAAEMKMCETLIHINHQEIEFVEQGKIPFVNGDEFKQIGHAYSYDLDIYGEHSLFQYLNRTATYIGKSTLAQLLLKKLSNTDIQKNQAAIKELADKLVWRQKIYASSIILNDNEKMYCDLIAWSKTKGKISKSLTIASFIMPVLFISVLIAFILTADSRLSTIALLLFMSNLAILYSRYALILKDVLKADSIHETILQYSNLLVDIENETFKSERLKELQDKLKDVSKASEQIKTLSGLFGSLISIQNAMASLIMNGIGLYHIHAYHALIRWKNEHGENVSKWLEVIGALESLNSIANFSYNNPTYTFPKLNDAFEINIEALGHPLIHASHRVCNTVSFSNQQFIILTGSNMSGKSTFLRSLGVNMVLAGTGSPICSSNANIHPLSVYVSMRLSDSLSDDESYFFAEVKRLKQIMDALKEERGFVLLDEILRGTNSDDKRNGTIEVIKKMIAYNAIGAIATHDLEICNTTYQYPDILTNKCFEVKTINDELQFDYMLREGICKNKSATFLMKKMGVI